jgi:hypothetical protein
MHIVHFGPPHRSFSAYFRSKHNAITFIRDAERYRYLGGVWKYRYWVSNDMPPLFNIRPLVLNYAVPDDISQRISPFDHLGVNTLRIATWQPAPAVATRSLLDEVVDHKLCVKLSQHEVENVTGVRLHHSLDVNIAKCDIMHRLTISERTQCTLLEQLAYAIYRKVPELRVQYTPFEYHCEAF